MTSPVGIEATTGSVEVRLRGKWTGIRGHRLATKVEVGEQGQLEVTYLEPRQDGAFVERGLRLPREGFVERGICYAPRAWVWYRWIPAEERERDVFAENGLPTAPLRMPEVEESAESKKTRSMYADEKIPGWPEL